MGWPCWEHFNDIPFEIVVETVDSLTGEIVHRELVGRSNVKNEADHRRIAHQRSIVDTSTHRVVVDTLSSKREA